MKADYISPYEGTWHRNDFTVGEQYVTNDKVFTCLTVNDGSYQDLELTVKWSDGTTGRVWPNMQWIALNWEDTTCCRLDGENHHHHNISHRHPYGSIDHLHIVDELAGIEAATPEEDTT